MSVSREQRRRVILLEAIERNVKRRAAAERERERAAAELAALLSRGVAAGVDVATMARAAGLSRQRAYQVLRGRRS